MTWRTNNLNFAEEDHHKQYGREWCLGLDHLTFLKSIGLSSHHNFLDIGCGSMRTGIHVAPLVNHYVGIDGHEESIKAAVEYEIPMNHLEDAPIKLVCNKDFEIKTDAVFDYIFAFSVFIHLSKEDRLKAIKMLLKHSNNKTKIVLNNRIPNDLLEYFDVAIEKKQKSQLSDNEIIWYVLKRK